MAFFRTAVGDYLLNSNSVKIHITCRENTVLVFIFVICDSNRRRTVDERETPPIHPSLSADCAGLRIARKLFYVLLFPSGKEAAVRVNAVDAEIPADTSFEMRLLSCR